MNGDTVLAHLLDHADELGEGPVELVEDAVEEGGGHVFVHTQQLRHVSLQQQRRTRLCTNQTTGRGQHSESSCDGSRQRGTAERLLLQLSHHRIRKWLLVSTQINT